MAEVGWVGHCRDVGGCVSVLVRVPTLIRLPSVVIVFVGNDGEAVLDLGGIGHWLCRSPLV